MGVVLVRGVMIDMVYLSFLFFVWGFVSAQWLHHRNHGGWLDGMVGCICG